jgi:hypothetical protein
MNRTSLILSVMFPCLFLIGSNCSPETPVPPTTTGAGDGGAAGHPPTTTSSPTAGAGGATTGSGGSAGVNVTTTGGGAGTTTTGTVDAGGGAAGSTAGTAGRGGTGGVSGTGGAGGAGGGTGGMAGMPGLDGGGMAACTPQFPYQDDPTLGTWLGADSAYSLALSPTATLWTFQDTFVGPQHQTGRANVPIIGNTLAIAECNGGAFSLRYAWTRTGPKAFFDDGNTLGNRFWTLQPWMHQGMLFAGLTEVRNAPGGFTELSTKLARVANPLDPPGSWRTEYFALAAIPGLGKGAVVHGPYVYLFGPFQNDQIVARLLLDDLVKPAVDPPALLQYLSIAGDWKAGLVTADAKKMGIAANTGISVRFAPGRSQWIALFMNTTGWPSANVAASSAPNLEGPWTRPVNVYSVQEMNPMAAGYDVDTICYAAIEHPVYNPDPDGQLLFTYTCNSAVFAKQIANMNIYLPRVVSIKNPLPR